MGARYLTWIDGVEATVELAERDGDTITATIIEGDEGPGRTIVIDLAERHGPRWTVVGDDGRVTRAFVTHSDRRHAHFTSGFVQLDVRVLSERDAWLHAGDDDSGEGAVTVAMPGRVVKVLVTGGDVVERGQPVLIIEAMKMENEVKAKRAGVVGAVHVSEGDSVEADLVMMEITDA